MPHTISNSPRTARLKVLVDSDRCVYGALMHSSSLSVELVARIVDCQAWVKRRPWVYHRVLMVRTLGRVRAAFLSACTAVCLVACASTTPIQPTYSQTELKSLCERHGGCWRPDDLVGGYCEFKS